MSIWPANRLSNLVIIGRLPRDVVIVDAPGGGGQTSRLTGRSQMSLSVNRIAGALGAEISGVDLSQPLDDGVIAEIRRALIEHLVIFFRDQHLTPEQHLAFGRRFGRLQVHDFVDGMDDNREIIEVRKEPYEMRNFGGGWHSDVSYLERPALGSGLNAPRRADEGRTSMGIHFTEEAHAEVDHPVVRTHPESGRKCLYVHGGFTVRFQDMTEEESAPLLHYLYRHAVRPEFTCRFRWEKNSIAFWDNRCVQHNAINDYQGKRRVMHRVTIEGERPV